MLYLREKKIICEVCEILTFAGTASRLTGLNYVDGGVRGGEGGIGQEYCSSAEAQTCNRGRIRCSLLVNSNQFYSCSLLITNQSGFKRERGRVVGGWDPLTKQAQIIEINKPQHINDNKMTQWFWGNVRAATQPGRFMRLHCSDYTYLVGKSY